MPFDNWICIREYKFGGAGGGIPRALEGGSYGNSPFSLRNSFQLKQKQGLLKRKPSSLLTKNSTDKQNPPTIELTPR